MGDALMGNGDALKGEYALKGDGKSSEVYREVLICAKEALMGNGEVLTAKRRHRATQSCYAGKTLNCNGKTLL